MNQTTNRSLNIAFSVVLLVAFFLPWMNIMGLVSAAGYELPIGLIDFKSQAAKARGGSIDTGVYLSLVLYLLPVLSLIHLVNSIRKRIDMGIALVTAAFPFALLIWVMTDVGGRVFDGMDIGAWLTLVAAAGIGTLALIGKNTPAQEKSAAGAEAESESRVQEVS